MPDEVVLDASVAAKWQLFDEPYVAEADHLRRRIEGGYLRLVVSAFWRYELAGILSKAAANGRIPEDEARDSLDDLLDVPFIIVPLPPPLIAFEAARRFNRSVIDCFYVSLAQERGCDFWSDDRKLCRALGAQFPFVRWIGEYPNPAAAPAETR